MNLKELLHRRITRRTTIGVILIFIGFLALITPFTPGSWLLLIGLELCGFRLLLVDKVKMWFKSKKTKKEA